MGYTDSYERDIHGIIRFWVENNYDHGRFLDREISHYEMELAKANQHMIRRLGAVLEQTQSQSVDPGKLIDEAGRATQEFHSLLVYTLDKSMKCEVIIATPQSLLDHLGYIAHYLDISNYVLHEQVREMKLKFEKLFLQANALRTMIRPPRNDVSPVLDQFSNMVIQEAKQLEAFKLELDDLIKKCAAVTTSPPDLLEHIAREAHHLWKNLEDRVVL